jgi:hypothetical protein
MNEPLSSILFHRIGQPAIAAQDPAAVKAAAGRLIQAPQAALPEMESLEELFHDQS